MIQGDLIPSPMAASRRQLAALVLALAACAGLRVWLIRNTAIITKDGTIYVRMAQQWSADPMGVVRQYDYSVGYPAAISALHGTVARLTGIAGVAAWELTGETISLLGALGAMVGVWVLAGRAFNWQVAGMTVLLFGAATKWALLGSDVVSDALAVCFQVWAVVVGLWALDLLERRRRMALFAAALAGLCAGAGYLVRPESLLAVIIVMLLWLVWQVRRRMSWRLTLSSVVVAGAVALAAGSPYMIAIGGITKKKSIEDVFFGLFNGCVEGPSLLAYASPLARGQVDVMNVVGQLTEAVHPILAVLIGLWLVSALVVRVLRSRLPKDVLPRPREKESAMVLLAAVVICPLMLSLSRLPGYPSYRHMTFLAALLAPLAAAELAGMARLVAAFAAWLWSLLGLVTLARMARQATLGVMVAALYVALVAHAVQRTHASLVYYRQAADYLAATLGPDDSIVSDTAWILHYSQLPGWPPVNLDRQTKNDLMDRIEKSTPPPTVLVVSTKILARADQRYASQGKGTFSELLERPMFVLTRKFPRDEHPGDFIRVYRIDRARISPAAAPATAPAVN